MKNTLAGLGSYARSVRKAIIEMATPVRSSHTGGAFSATDLLVVLYFEILKIDPARPDDPCRDIFVYSKGHSSSALYAVLSERGFFSPDLLKEYYVDGGRLPGHPVRRCVPGVEVSSGSLGHGLPMGVGLALARKLDKNPSRVFVMISDGECDEGSVWEAAMLAGHHGLDNLTVIVDFNKIQSLGRTEEVVNLEPLKKKWSAFNWAAREIDGHNLSSIYNTLKRVPFKKGYPSAVVAHTVKGRGVSFMEGQLEWHYRSLDDQGQYLQALKEVERS
ncbi:MAG: transketolase [Parcubacteria group bacterium]|nr:transketolase [Parcubacteria group bacterium]